MSEGSLLQADDTLYTHHECHHETNDYGIDVILLNRTQDAKFVTKEQQKTTRVLGIWHPIQTSGQSFSTTGVVIVQLYPAHPYNSTSCL